MATDVEIERALNALTVTLNDQRLDRMDLDRLQRIVVASLGGERHLHVAPDAEAPDRAAWLRDDTDKDVGRVELDPGPHWTSARC